MALAFALRVTGGGGISFPACLLTTDEGRAAILEPFWGWRFSDRPPSRTIWNNGCLSLRAEGLRRICLSLPRRRMAFGFGFCASLSVGTHHRVLSSLLLLQQVPIYVNNVFTWPTCSPAHSLQPRLLNVLYDRRAAAGAHALGALEPRQPSRRSLTAAVYGCRLALRSLASRYPAGSVSKRCALAALTALILYAPWIGFQKFVDPPGRPPLEMATGRRRNGPGGTTPLLEQLILNAYC